MQKKIRKIAQNDLSNVVEMLQQVSAFKPDIAQITQAWRSYINQTNVYAFVVTFNEEIIGFGSVIYEQNIRSGIRGHIEDIVVSKKYQKQGVGKEIIDNIISYSKEQGCYKLSLQCNDENINFYKKLGFNVSGCSMSNLLL